MNTYDDFVGRVRGLVIVLQPVLTAEEAAEIEHLIDHDEPGEALVTLAWIIVNGDKRIPADVYRAIQEFSRGIVTEEHMPPNLEQHVFEAG